jgi:hypothetical protein
MLIDDSALKAALQPWNHLCIKEYVAEMRSIDLTVANFGAARKRLHEAREALEREKRQKEDQKRQEEEKADFLRQEDEKRTSEAVNNPENIKVIREVAMVEGKMVGEEHVVKKVSREVVMVNGEMVGEQEDEGSLAGDIERGSTKNRKRKLKRIAKKEALLRVKEELAQDAAKAVEDAEFEEGEIDPTEIEREHESEEAKLEALASKMKYDETLLAVVGVLDHIKYEGSVAGWMRHGGLLNVELAEDASRLSDNPYGSPPKKRRLNKTDSFHGTGHTPSSPSTLPPSSSQNLPPSPSDQPSSPPPPHRVEERDEQAQTGVPLLFSDTSMDGPPPPSLWFERPAVMSYWADRGRRALQALDITAESGVMPV